MLVLTIGSTYDDKHRYFNPQLLCLHIMQLPLAFNFTWFWSSNVCINWSYHCFRVSMPKCSLCFHEASTRSQLTVLYPKTPIDRSWSSSAYSLVGWMTLPDDPLQLAADHLVAEVSSIMQVIARFRYTRTHPFVRMNSIVLAPSHMPCADHHSDELPLIDRLCVTVASSEHISLNSLSTAHPFFNTIENLWDNSSPSQVMSLIEASSLSMLPLISTFPS